MTDQSKSFKGVMISSTFKDLVPYRDALEDILKKQHLFPIGMEHYVPAPDDDEISSSLNMVEAGHGYIGIISHRCGGIYECVERNPLSLSICRLEFEKAQALKLPTLVFVMSKKCLVSADDVEIDPHKVTKLNDFRELAKKGRIYIEFDSPEDFKGKAVHAVVRLREYLDEHERQAPVAPPSSTPPSTEPPMPRPPELYAEPRYLGSHEFVGRQQQLETLNDWAAPADVHPVLLFEAIGGSGKSMLTWHWLQGQRQGTGSKPSQPWAGRFWYSFYERGAEMADFCRHALAYITGTPLKEMEKLKMDKLAPDLLAHLQARPWLLVLDGLERVLVAYNRYDAAQVRDEEAGTADAIAQRDPCASIHPEDDELLHQLAAAAPSKILITSRLIPRALLNLTNQAIPGVLHERLPGLRPADAEALFRACGVKGQSQAMQTYLKAHCDCHPLTIGALAGLVMNHRAAPGDFDHWLRDPQAGGGWDFKDLNLTQKRNHILEASIKALPPGSRRLLSLLALLSEAVAYGTLEALNPDLPKEPEKTGKPHQQALQTYQAQKKAAKQSMDTALGDLEKRGLIQREGTHYDLHPVVRGVAADGVGAQEKQTLGQRLVDYFSSRPHDPYEKAENLEDVRDGLHLVRAYLQMGQYQKACDVYHGDLARALIFNLEANAEILALLKPFFPEGWSVLPEQVANEAAAYLANDAATALGKMGQWSEERAAKICALRAYMEAERTGEVRIMLSNLGSSFRAEKAELCYRLALEAGERSGDSESLFRALLDCFFDASQRGCWEEAEALWRRLDPMGRRWSRAVYWQGYAEFCRSRSLFWQGKLSEDELNRTEQLVREGRNREIIRWTHGLRGEWHLACSEWALAIPSLERAVQMAHEVGRTDPAAETRLALARLPLGQLADPRRTAERLSQASQVSDLELAALWLALGEREQATAHALNAYQRAWADGEPYVRRYDLNRARDLLEQLGEPMPSLAPYDPAKREKLEWEDEVRAYLDKLRKQQEEAEAKRGVSEWVDGTLQSRP